jgi:2-amino-4-hydroxy-6-hydroxymethyldihydropteridine diphosphokinase
MNKVYLGLGSNVGDSIGNIRQVIQEFLSDNRFNKVEYSSLYESTPYGNEEQSNFLNGVISFSTDLSLNELFLFTKKLEKRIGRIKRQTWGPREIDIDILLYGDSIVNSDKLSIPHKGLLDRDFVLVPLIELNENLMHPVEKKKIKSFLSELNDKYIIDKINFSLSEQNLTEQNQ